MEAGPLIWDTVASMREKSNRVRKLAHKTQLSDALWKEFGKQIMGGRCAVRGGDSQDSLFSLLNH